jgi:hypothetical protein
MLVSTSERGQFDFDYTPDTVGNWTVIAQWQSDKGYYTSAYSEPTILEVTEAPSVFNMHIEYVYAIAIALIMTGIVLTVYPYIKRNRKQSVVL